MKAQVHFCTGFVTKPHHPVEVVAGGDQSPDCPWCGQVMTFGHWGDSARRYQWTGAGYKPLFVCAECGMADWEFEPALGDVVCRFCGKNSPTNFYSDP